MSQIRVAEVDLYQDLEDDKLRETFRSMAENIRNLQAQIDEKDAQIEILESGSSSATEVATSSTVDTSSIAISMAIALG